MAYNTTQQARIDQGQCPQCGTETADKRYCVGCRQGIKAAREKRLAKAVTGKACVCCGESRAVFLRPLQQGHVTCHNCLAAYQRQGSCPHQTGSESS